MWNASKSGHTVYSVSVDEAVLLDVSFRGNNSWKGGRFDLLHLNESNTEVQLQNF